MQKFYYPVALILFSLSLGVVLNAKNNSANKLTLSAETGLKMQAPEISFTEKSDALYREVGLANFGLSKQAFDYAYKGYQNLLEENKIEKTEYLTICDFSQPSSKKRLYIVDVESKELFLHTYVAHGRNSGGLYATRFSNKPESLQSSLGFYVTSNTYYGGHGLSLNLEGMDRGFNDNAYNRRIVVHGASYATKWFVQQNKYLGRSFGCPAVPQQESAKIINAIKDGSCLFIYHPTKKYIQNSKILNG